jgi:hypothetical protein
MAPGRRLNDQDQQARADHDLLIEIKTKLDGALQMFTTKADGQSVTALAGDVKDHEDRMRALEFRVFVAVGALTAMQIGFGVYVALWK